MLRLQGKRIFVVEDNPVNRVVFRTSLALSGAHLIFENSGRDTIIRMNAVSNIDIVLLDLMLPAGLSGYNIFAEIRTLPHFDHIPIVAVSAADAAIAIPKTQEFGFSGFISKPIDEEFFPFLLDRILHGEDIWYDGSPLLH